MGKIYLAQMAPVLNDKNQNINKMHDFIKRAYEQNADLILFPELALTGYFTREKTRELAENLQGRSIRAIQEYARTYNMMIVFGFPELIGRDVYDSAVVINHDGEILGAYQKIHLWDEETEYFSYGENFCVWDTHIGKIGIMICFDTEFPETARLLALQGAQLILAPTANMPPFENTQRLQIPCRAIENQVFVATTNRVGSEESTRFFGESAAADPSGNLLVRADQTESGYLVEFELDDICKAREKPDYLNDRRPELYKDLGGG